jgi:hypothetical protein
MVGQASCLLAVCKIGILPAGFGEVGWSSWVALMLRISITLEQSQ